MEVSSFFNSVNGDRRYKAEAWAEQISSIITSGILANPANNLRVAASADMTILVKAGRAWINGYFYWLKADKPITVPMADGVLKRIDRIVIRWSLSERRIYAALKKGTPASSPMPPAVQRDADVYELVVGDVTVNKGVVEIVAANIADTRYLTELCGKIAPLFDELDLSDFYEECSRRMTEQIELWETQTAGQKTSFDSAMDGFKAQITDIKNDYINWKGTIESWKSLTIAELAKAVSFNFENQLAYEGTKKITTETDSGCASVLKFKSSNKVIAEQTTEEKPDETVEITQKVYNTDGSVFRNVKMIVTSADDTITAEVVAI